MSHPCLWLYADEETNVLYIAIAMLKQKFIALAESLAIDINTLRKHFIEIEGALSLNGKNFITQI